MFFFLKMLQVTKKLPNFVSRKAITMKLKKRELLYQEAGKYFLDLSKLVFGGIILAEIMNLEINDEAMLIIGGVLVLVFGFIGYRFYSKSKG